MTRAEPRKPDRTSQNVRRRAQRLNLRNRGQNKITSEGPARKDSTIPPIGIWQRFGDELGARARTNTLEVPRQWLGRNGLRSSRPSVGCNKQFIRLAAASEGASSLDLFAYLRRCCVCGRAKGESPCGRDDGEAIVHDEEAVPGTSRLRVEVPIAASRGRSRTVRLVQQGA